MLEVPGRARLLHCLTLRDIGPDLFVGQELVMYNNPHLTALPPRLTALGGLSVKGSINLTELPLDLRVRNFLDVNNSPGVSTIPVSVMAPGLAVEARQTSVTPAAARAMEAAYGVTVCVEKRAEACLASVLAGWALSAPRVRVSADAFVWVGLKATRVKTVLRFLQKLELCEDAQDPACLPALAARVLDCFNLLACREDAQEVLDGMYHSVQTCVDKPAWFVNQAHAMVLVRRARGDRALLRKLGRRLMHLQFVHEHARALQAQAKTKDYVQLYLQCEVNLREVLDLPVGAETMRFPYFRHTVLGASAVVERCMAVSDEEFDAWLENWEEWRRQDRLEAAAALDWDALPAATEDVRVPAEDFCGERMQRPVLLRKQVWALHNVLRHWVSTGTDLMNVPLSISQLRAELRSARPPQHKPYRRKRERALETYTATPKRLCAN